MDKPKVRILCVCLGNICRSPMAKWILQDLATKQGLASHVEIDSCGTGNWHAGGGADPRSAKCGLARGLNADHVARQISAEDVRNFDLILVMDRANRRNVLALGADPDKVRLIRSFDPSLTGAEDRDLEVPDPYHGGEQGFDVMYDMLRNACEGVLQAIRERRKST